MFKIEFSERELTDIAEAIDNPEIHEKFKRKLLTLRMHHLEVGNQVIASTLCISADSVTNYIKQYKEGGLATVLEDRSYRPVSSLEPFMDCLRCFFTVRPPATAKEAMAYIEQLTGIKLSEEQVRKTLKKLGLSYRRTGQIPGKANPQLQFEFFTQKLEPRLEEASRGKRKVFFVDAAHFVLGCFLGMVWCFTRLFVKGASGRQRYNVLGAVDSHSKELISIRTSDYINAIIVTELIDLIREKHPTAEITLVMDNARYQRCKLVIDHAAAKEVELLFLPSYSPNLNIIERLWKLVKTNCLRNRYFPDFAAFRSAIDTFLDEINEKHQPKLESCLTLKFQFFPIPNL
jgi:transposase